MYIYLKGLVISRRNTKLLSEKRRMKLNNMLNLYVRNRGGVGKQQVQVFKFSFFNIIESYPMINQASPYCELDSWNMYKWLFFCICLVMSWKMWRLLSIFCFCMNLFSKILFDSLKFQMFSVLKTFLPVVPPTETKMSTW